LNKIDETTIVDGKKSAAPSTSKDERAISILVLISRLTGFVRTSAQAYALGVTAVASCYSVANNLPNMLYELVIGGMIVTAFLPTYMAAKRDGGKDGASEYASSLTMVVLVVTGIATALAMIFASQLIWTQSFSAGKNLDSGLATWFFRFFACEVMLYSLSSVLSGILNAERDYIASSAAPIANNAVVTIGFVAYALLVHRSEFLALLCIAIASPLGVVIQVVAQLPSLRKHGISLRHKPSWRGARMRETMALGIPAFVVMIASFVTASFQQSASLAITPSGASVVYYARLWYTLPYAVFSVPITTTAFTEMSDAFVHGKRSDGNVMVGNGVARQLITMLPMTALLMAFAPYLSSILGLSGNGMRLVSEYVIGLAIALPLYAVGMFLQKASSASGTASDFAIANAIGGAAQCVMCMLVQGTGQLWLVGVSTAVFFLVTDIIAVILMARHGVAFSWRLTTKSCVAGLVIALACFMASNGLTMALTACIGTCSGVGILRAIVPCVIVGLPMLTASLYGTSKAFSFLSKRTSA
jgi:putative peptidoglycan lipid II flippase